MAAPCPPSKHLSFCFSHLKTRFSFDDLPIWPCFLFFYRLTPGDFKPNFTPPPVLLSAPRFLLWMGMVSGCFGVFIMPTEIPSEPPKGSSEARGEGLLGSCAICFFLKIPRKAAVFSCFSLIANFGRRAAFFFFFNGRFDSESSSCFFNGCFGWFLVVL